MIIETVASKQFRGLLAIRLVPEPGKGEKGKTTILLDGRTGDVAYFRVDLPGGQATHNRALYAMKEPGKWLKNTN